MACNMFDVRFWLLRCAVVMRRRSRQEVDRAGGGKDELVSPLNPHCDLSSYSARVVSLLFLTKFPLWLEPLLWPVWPVWLLVATALLFLIVTWPATPTLVVVATAAVQSSSH